MALGPPTRTVSLNSPVSARRWRLTWRPSLTASRSTAIFPGYYTGRATHVHIKVHTKWEPNANGTFTTGGIVHTGQFFVEDSINEVIDKIHPYTENPIKNKWGRTRNWDDSLKIYQESHQNGYFPTFELSKLGGNIQSGLYGAITVGVDMSKDYVSRLVGLECRRRGKADLFLSILSPSHSLPLTLHFLSMLAGPWSDQPGPLHPPQGHLGSVVVGKLVD